MRKIAVVLSGCGMRDGSEIHEAVITLLSIIRCGAQYECFSPDVSYETIDHLTDKKDGSTRSALVESARIARGDIRNLKDADPKEYDAVIFPGGFGAAKNLCDFATQGENCTVIADVEKFCHGMIQAGKPAGFICIAPVMIPKLYPKGVRLTIGHDAETAQAITAMGGVHVPCKVTDIVTDGQNKVVSTPAYMLAKDIAEAAEGIEKLVEQVLWLAKL